MKWLKGIGLFLIANFLIYLTLSITVNILINVVLPEPCWTAIRSLNRATMPNR